MPDDSDRGGSAPRVDWDRLRPGTDARKRFEDLCCFLAEREPSPDGSEFERLAPPDGGVECLRRLPGGQEWGWQAKYFQAAPSHGQWRQIDRSVRKALKANPRLVRYIVCAPVDKTRAGAAKWGRLVGQWNAIRPMAYEYWGRHELESRLIIDKNHDLLKYYFDKEFLSAEWADRTVSAAIADAGPRYTPEQNIDLPIGKSFEALCGTGEFFGRLDSIAASMRDHLSAAATKPALDAAGGELANLGNLTDGIAALLTGHALHKRDGIPATEIREKSHDAKAAVSGIASKLAGKGRENGKKQAGQHYTGDAFDIERHHLRLLYGDLDELADGKLSEDMDIHKTRALLVVGDAGVGKTHLFCDMAKRCADQKQMTVLLHGSHFYGGPPKEAIVRDLDLDCRFLELLEGLNLAGQLSGSRSLLMIDALNEGAGRDTWKRHIRGLLQEIGSFPHVALALSVRTNYEPEVVPDDIKPPALRRIEHPGFGGRTEAALARFFDCNGIERPAVPVMTPEYSNPQFLTVLCRGLKNKGYTRMPDDVDGITAVYDLFIDSVNDKLAEGGKLGIARDFRIVHRAIDAIAGRLVEGNGESLEYTEAHRLLSGLEPTLSLDRLLDALISEGVLGAYSSKSQSRTHVRRVRFAYERMSDNLVIKSLLDAAAANGGGGPAAMLKESGPLAAYVANPARHRGLVDALSAQLPERFEAELLEATEGAPVKELTESFLDSLLWRSPRGIGDAAVRLVDELLTERRFSGRVLKALLAHSTNLDSPLNADYLHQHLLCLGMADRDGYLAVFLQGNPAERHSIVASLTSWAGNEGQKFGDDTIRLAGLALGWLLTSSNRPVRDLSTKALVAMFSGREGTLVDVMSEFRGCDDPYVAERLFCAAYGLAMRSRSNEGLKRLAAYAYETVFESRSPPPDIMLRDYARGIIILAEHRGVDLGVDLGSCSPPHNSDWIAEFPSETDIKNLEQLHGASRGGRGASSIFHSLGPMGDFHRYVVGGDEDGGQWINARLPEDKTTWPEALAAFDRSVTPAQEQLWKQLASMLSDRMRAGTLVIDPKTDRLTSSDPHYDAMLEDLVRRFEPLLSPVQAARFNDRILRHLKYSLRPFSEEYGFDTAQFARWIAKRVFDLGWTADRFERHDGALGSRPAPPGGAERVGKKYQWIAYHELLARLSDNFDFADPDGTGQASVYESTGQLLSKRDIDPSLPYSLAAAEAARPGPCDGSWAAVVRGGLDVIQDDAEWLKDASDLPHFGKMLTVTDGGGAGWLALDMFYAADSRPVRGQAERPRPHRRVALWARSAVVPKKGGSALAGLARRRRLGLLKFPGSMGLHGAFLGELYWAGRFQKDHGGGARPDDGIEIVVPGGGRIGAYRTTYKYHAEGDHDFSLEKNTTILVPSAFLARGMNLASMCDGTFSDAGGACIACDVAASKTNPHTLLFRQGPLSEFLASSGCELVWNVVAHKYVIDDSGTAGGGKPSQLAVNSVCRMRGGGKPKLVWSDTDEA